MFCLRRAVFGMCGDQVIATVLCAQVLRHAFVEIHMRQPYVYMETITGLLFKCGQQLKKTVVLWTTDQRQVQFLHQNIASTAATMSAGWGRTAFSRDSATGIGTCFAPSRRGGMINVSGACS